MKFEKKIDTGGIIAISVSVLIFIIGLCLYKEVEVLRKIEDFKLAIGITEPNISKCDSINAYGYLYCVSGKLSSGFVKGTNLQLELQKNDLMLMPFVKPLNKDFNKYFAGSEIVIDTGGRFNTRIQLGDKFNGIGATYEIVLAIVKTGYFTPGDLLINPPQGSGRSESIIVKRLQ